MNKRVRKTSECVLRGNVDAAGRGTESEPVGESAGAVASVPLAASTVD